MENRTILFVHIHRSGGAILCKIIDNLYKKGDVFKIEEKFFRESVKEFKTLSDEQKRKYKIIMGRQFFGLHESLPQKSVYITMLREPLNRVLSNYYWALQYPDFPYHDKIKKESLSFERFMHYGIGASMDNGMTRFISGYDLDRVPYGQCDESILKIAKKM